MLAIDASAYPHIVEAILSDPVAWRATRTLNRYWRDTIDEAMSVVTVTDTGRLFLATSATARLPQHHFQLHFDTTLSSRLDRLPPIRRLHVRTWIPMQCYSPLPDILGKVHTTYVLSLCVGWTHPCETLISDEQVPLHVPRGVRKLVILKHDTSERYPFDPEYYDSPDYDLDPPDPFPLSVSEVTVSFHPCRKCYHQPTVNLDSSFFVQLAQALVSGCVLNIVDLLAAGLERSTAYWFTTELHCEVESQLLHPPLPAPLVTEPFDEVMGRLKFFDLDSYRQLNPGEI